MANLVINLSVFAFFPLAFSTSSSIFETVDSPNAFVTFIVSTPFTLIEPLIICSFIVTSLGKLSPVSEDVSTLPAPSVIIPSRGTFSPGFTTIISPTFTADIDGII